MAVWSEHNLPGTDDVVAAEATIAEIAAVAEREARDLTPAEQEQWWGAGAAVEWGRWATGADGPPAEWFHDYAGEQGFCAGGEGWAR